jgi:hypothetical protein
MRSIGRGLLVAALVAGLCELPVAAGTSEKPLGVVLVAEHAHQTGEKAVAGTTVFAGDAFDTEDAGTIGLRVGTSQLFLLAGSAAAIGENSKIARIQLTRGTMVFSSSASGEFELETPAGVLREMPGEVASGRVALTGPNEMIVSSYRGGVVLDNDGELHTILAGKSYRVVFEDSEVTAAAEPDDPSTPYKGRRRRKLAFYIVTTAAVAGISAAIWNKLSESPYKPK